VLRAMNEPSSLRRLFHEVLSFRAPGRSLTTLVWVWPSTMERWQGEGMPPECVDQEVLRAYLGLDPSMWVTPQAETFVYPPLESVVLEETEEKVTRRDSLGITSTSFKDPLRQSMPQYLAFPVQSHADWEAYRERLVWRPERVGEAWARQQAELRGREAPVVIEPSHGASLYGALRDMLGMERLSYLWHDDPGWLEEMLDTLVELFGRTAEALYGDFTPDAVCFFEDMAYKHGPLVSPRHVRELLVPRYRVMVDKLRELGVPFVFLDSDGKVEELIPLWREAGIDGVMPMEVNAGMDVEVYRERYPRLLMMGGVDKRALARGREAIDREMEKVARVVRGGGYLPWTDHAVPHDISWDNFRYYAERLKEVCGRA
jgi:hypothetical protein